MLSQRVIHHGAGSGVTGSCHELVISGDVSQSRPSSQKSRPRQSSPNGPSQLNSGSPSNLSGPSQPNNESQSKPCSILIDCGLFQGSDLQRALDGATDDQSIEFPIDHIEALLITHCHIDHVGRLPWLLIAGFRGPIYCTEATAHLLPLVIEDALRVGMTRNRQLINAVTNRIQEQLRPQPYNQPVELQLSAGLTQVCFRQAGHILGSSYIEVDLPSRQRVVFSGDLGCKNTPLLPDPKPLERADLLVLESTYGDRNHENRSERQQRLRRIVEHCVEDRGAVLIPAFSIGRTQELLYELEDIIYRELGDDAGSGVATAQEGAIAAKNGAKNTAKNVATAAAKNAAPRSSTQSPWHDLQIILDSPMAARFTEQYIKMRALWDAEAKQRLQARRHPLDFAQLHVIDSHEQHMDLVAYLKQSGDPCIVIAASGMCAGGRIQNYLEALLPAPRTDVLFVGYQAQGTPGADIQKYGPNGGYVVFDSASNGRQGSSSNGKRIDIKAQIHTLGGYSAHADQQELLDFIESGVTNGGIAEIRLVHGEPQAKQTLTELIKQRFDIPVS